MARSSSFTYKGRAVDVREIAEDLSVRYVLEGSVSQAGRRVRITGQLIDAASGGHIWADRFDGDMEAIFELQDNVTASVVGAIEPSLRKAEIERSRRKRPDSLAAYDLFLRALMPLNKFRPEATAEALEFLEAAIAIDPGYAPALAYAAWCYEQRLLHDWPTKQEGDAETAVALAIVGHDFDGGAAAVKRALELNPNSTAICWKAGWVIMFAGVPQGWDPRRNPDARSTAHGFCGARRGGSNCSRDGSRHDAFDRSQCRNPRRVHARKFPACQIGTGQAAGQQREQKVRESWKSAR